MFAGRKGRASAALSFAAGCVLIAASADAWQLQNLTLEERLSRAPVIVVASVQRELSVKKSDFAGVGLCREAEMAVSRVLKGDAPDVFTAAWCEVAEAEAGSPALEGEHIWLLAAPSEGVYRPAGNFAAILPLAERDEVVELLWR